MRIDFMIRRLTKEDLASFFELRLESLQNSPTSFLGSFEEEKGSSFSFYEAQLTNGGVDSIIFGAFVNTELVGLIGIYRENRIKIKHKSYLWGMYVKPEYRNNGIAKALLFNAINHAQNKMKCTAIHISVEVANIAAKKLYESFGFKEWGKEPKAIYWDEKYFDEYHMMLWF